MKGLENIARRIAIRLRKEGRITEDHRLKQDSKTRRLLNHYPCWTLAYEVEPLKAVFISDSMAQILGLPPGFVRTEDEYRTVHHCDMTTAYNRFQTYEYFHGGGKDVRGHVATLMLPDDTPVFVDDLACPIVEDEDGRTTCFAHFFAERGRPTLVNAYVLCDPDDLTPKQREVFSLLLMGWKAMQITSHLDISQKTLDKHVAAILALTGQAHVTALLEKCNQSD